MLRNFLIAVVFTFPLVACQSKENPSLADSKSIDSALQEDRASSQPATAAAVKSDWCSLFSSAEVSEFLGVPTSLERPTADGCVWAYLDEVSKDTRVMGVGPASRSDVMLYSRIKDSPEFQPLPNIGDVAALLNVVNSDTISGLACSSKDCVGVTFSANTSPKTVATALDLALKRHNK
jgi:hypothetical protein